MHFSAQKKRVANWNEIHLQHAFLLHQSPHQMNIFAISFAICKNAFVSHAAIARHLLLSQSSILHLPIIICLSVLYHKSS